MTNDDKVKLANEILAIDDVEYEGNPNYIYFEARGLCTVEQLQAIVSEWLQFTQFDPCKFVTFGEQCYKPYGHDGSHEVNIKHLLPTPVTIAEDVVLETRPLDEGFTVTIKP
jgi:hypothetical protein